MSDTTAFPPEYDYRYEGKKYVLPFEPEKPLHIPAGYHLPMNEETISWGYDGTPYMYCRNVSSGDYWQACITRNPKTGQELLDISLYLEDAPVSQVQATLGEIIAWFHLACNVSSTAAKHTI